MALYPFYPTSWEQKKAAPRITTGLLTACKTTHSEATPVLYGSNTFNVNYNNQFLQRIRRYIPHIRRYVIRHSAKKHRHADFVLLKAATSLSYLELPSLYCEDSGSTRNSRQILAKEMGPLFRSLHKSQKKDLEKKDRDVLDVLVVSTGWMSELGWGDDEADAMAKQWEDEIKEALRMTLK